MFVRGFTGFGGALLTVPLLSLIWDVQQAIVVTAFIQVVTGGMLTFKSRGSIVRSELMKVMIPSLVGLVGGVALLSILAVRWVTIGLGVFSIAAGLHLLLQTRRTVESHPAGSVTTGGVGLFGGLLQGMVGASGPVVVPYLQRIVSRASNLRATLLAYFLVLDALRLLSYVPLGIAGRSMVAPSLYILPFALAASLAGGRLQIQLPEVVFRVSVAGLLILAGVLLLF